ncbi:phage tail protein [Variovorax sp.]|uniref:phage tail protein n=1 Tax=Variovorax sp. TaxID=1871043 RepID=UPI003BAA93B6
MSVPESTSASPMPSIEVVWCPNPLRVNSERQTHRMVLSGDDTVASMIKRLGLSRTPLHASLDGVQVPDRKRRKRRVQAGQVLVLTQDVKGIEAAEIAFALGSKGMSFTTAIALGTVLAFAANLAISFAVTALISSLSRKNGPGQQQNKTGPNAYGVEGGSNGLRPYEPLPLVLGEHRMFPDYASRPFSEFVLDPSTATEVINNTPQTSDMTPPPFELILPDPPESVEEIEMPSAIPPWTLLDFDDAFDLVFFGDNASRTFQAPTQWGGSAGGEVTMPHSFVVRCGYNPMFPAVPPVVHVTTYEAYQARTTGGGSELDWHVLTPGITLPIIVRYGYTAIYKTERLVSIFNFGFGDLEITDVKIGPNPASMYNAVELHHSSVPSGAGDRTQLVGYTSDGWPGDAYPDNVQVVEGGRLEQPPMVENSGWIVRESSQPVRITQIDIAGRLFFQSDRGISTAFCQFEVEYRDASSGAWSPMPYSPFVLSSGTSTPVRETFTLVHSGEIDAIRARRVTPDPTDSALISEFEMGRVKFMRDSSALYPAQHRMGMLIKATGQLNGRIDRLSAMVKAKHWRWTPAGVWAPGAYPGAAGWEWAHTVNPAWLFLYYARGGFLNATAAPAHLGLAGWLDEPATDNGARLFGAGLENARIDYLSIVAWAQYCDAAGLECRMVITSARSCGDVLDDIAAAGRASKTWANGKLGVVWEAAGQPVAASFGMSNVAAGTFKIAYLSDDPIDEFELAYTRSDGGYEADTVRATVPGVELPINRASEQAVYSMSRSQAQRLVNLLAASRAYHRRTIQFDTNMIGNTVQRGDVVQLAHDLTRWAYSGRLVSLVADDGFIRQVVLSAEVENPTGEEVLYLQVFPPGGAPFSVACAPPTGRTRTLEVEGDWPVASAPGLLADDVSRNMASAYPGTIPEDWTWLGGPTATPGKRCRIIAMEPSANRRLRLTLRDEYEAYYPLEWGLGDVPSLPSGERLVARAINAAATPAPNGGTLLRWELEAAHGADVFVQVNGGPSEQVPIQGHITVAGRELLLPAYPPGTHVYIEVRPVTGATPVAVESSTLTLDF